MKKGINLSLTKSLADFNKLLDKAIKAVSSKKLSTDFQSDDSIFGNLGLERTGFINEVMEKL